jgi:large subunit ribosomal protein L4
MNNRRQSTAHTKGRGQVSGGGKKPWRQKGTGRARQGSIRSPQWRHGGVVFGPTNEKIYGGKINKKMRRKALAMILSAKASGNSLLLLENIEVSQPKTKEMFQILENIKKVNNNFKKGRILIALGAGAENTVLASRNIAGVETIEAAKLNVLDLMNASCLLMPVNAIETIGKTGAREALEAAEKEVVKSARTVKRAAKIKK